MLQSTPSQKVHAPSPRVFFGCLLNYEVPIIMVQLESDTFFNTKRTSKCQVDNSVASVTFAIGAHQGYSLRVSAVVEFADGCKIQDGIHAVRGKKGLLKRAGLIIV